MAQTIGSLFNDQLRLASLTLACFAFDQHLREDPRRDRDEELAHGAVPGQGHDPALPGNAEERGRLDDGGRRRGRRARLAQCGFFVVAMAKYGEGDQVESLLRAIYRNARFSLERHDFKQLPTLMACLPLGFGGGMDEDFRP
jgi:hypothetical protein